ncbi:cytidine and dCMP deaminase domain-containing protein 1-like [Scyliorhinus canicula]|uniref:cytidine and dCMP deaminase domain-containing protein 1-like n=1 Tax=Scyliorhinus canicula TaxID=7830 RepID=UPI0018F5D420|nr:cytidine and dCMP deaminase domain-containing protein 1-like [Scyliorhinus canicula]
MVSSKIPCSECEKAINACGIKTVVSVKDLPDAKKPTEGGGSKKTAQELAVGAQGEGKEMKTILWEWPSELRGNQDNTDPPTKTHSSDVAVSVSPVRLPNKDDLLMYLALQMEKSPLCKEPKEKGDIKFSKTGITIFAGGGTNQILVIDCSRNGLHAVQQVLLSFPKCLQGNVVYLSRHPCVHCAKLLLQGGVLQLYYWPCREQADNAEIAEIAENVNQLFCGAKVGAEMYIPVVSLRTVKENILPKIRLKPSEQSKEWKSIFDLYNEEPAGSKKSKDPFTLDKILEALDLSYIKGHYRNTFKEKVDNASKCLSKMQISEGTFEKIHNRNIECQDAKKEKRDLHALQLCFLLAARTDSPGPGVGALIYQDGCFVGIGYNGFPRGNRRGQYFQNFRKKKASGAQQQSTDVIICAEANALYFRSERCLKDAVLYSSSYPCNECLALIKETKHITDVICVAPKKRKSLKSFPKDLFLTVTTTFMEQHRNRPLEHKQEQESCSAIRACPPFNMADLDQLQLSTFPKPLRTPDLYLEYPHKLNIHGSVLQNAKDSQPFE